MDPSTSTLSLSPHILDYRSSPNHELELEISSLSHQLPHDDSQLLSATSSSPPASPSSLLITPHSPLSHSPTHLHPLKTAFRNSFGPNRHVPLSSLNSAYPFLPFDSQPSPDSFSPGIESTSTTSSDESRSPLENPLDVDFSDGLDSMADFEYGYPLSTLSGAFAGESFSSPINERKAQYQQQRQHHQPQTVHVNNADTDSLVINGSPCIYPNSSFPVKQEYYAPSVATMSGSYGAYMSSPETHSISVPVSHGHSNHPQQQPTYPYTGSPESPYLDATTAYYSPPAQLAPMIIASPHSSSVSHPHSQVHQSSQAQATYPNSLPSCDPRFVSASPPDVSFRAFNTSTGSGPVHSQTEPGMGFGTGSGLGNGQLPTRYMGAFGSPPETEEIDTDDGINGESEVEEDQRNSTIYHEEDEQDEVGDDDAADSDYIDGNEGRQRLGGSRLRALNTKNRGRRISRPLIVPSQAARVSALTTPVIPSSSSGVLSFQADQQQLPSLSPASGAARTQRTTRPSAPAPVPVPNLTKKSRGRRVPTHPGVLYATAPEELTQMSNTAFANTGGSKRLRGYTCRVPGCGKCFARGEHLKRHIRSIHTNEKRKLQLTSVIIFSILEVNV